MELYNYNLQNHRHFYFQNYLFFLIPSETQPILVFLLLLPNCFQEGKPKLPNSIICHHTDGVTSHQKICPIGASNGSSQVSIFYSNSVLESTKSLSQMLICSREMVSFRLLTAVFLSRHKLLFVLSNTRFTALSLPVLIQIHPLPTYSSQILQVSPAIFTSQASHHNLLVQHVNLITTDKKLSQSYSSLNHHLNLLSLSSNFFPSAYRNILTYFLPHTHIQFLSLLQSNQARQGKETQSTEETVLLFSSGAQPKLRAETIGQVYFREDCSHYGGILLSYKDKRFIEHMQNQF